MTTQRLLLLLTVGGAATYGCTYLAGLGFLTRFRVSSDEVSISYSSLLPRAVAGLLVPLVATAAALVPVGSITHHRLLAANRRAAREGRPQISEAVMLQCDFMGALLLPVVWAVGVLVCLRVLTALSPMTWTAPLTVGAWLAVLGLPLLPSALVQAMLTRVALFQTRRAAAAPDPPSATGPPVLPTVSGTAGMLVLLAAMVVLPVMAGGYAYGAHVAGQLTSTGDLEPQRVDYTVPGSWLVALLLPQVTCVRAEWVGSPPPTALPVGPALNLGTANDVAVLYDLNRRRTARVYVGSALITSVPDSQCRR